MPFGKSAILRPWCLAPAQWMVVEIDRSQLSEDEKNSWRVQTFVFFHSLYMCVNCRDAFCQCGSITHLLAEAGCVRSSVRRRRKNYDALTWRRWRCRRKKTKSRQTFNKNSCDLLTAITHTKILVAYFSVSEPPFPQIDIIGIVVIVWRARGKLSGLFCAILCATIVHSVMHTHYEQT